MTLPTNLLYNNIKLAIFCLMSVLFLECSSDDECTKTIIIPQTFFVGNQSYTNEIEQEVPCDFPEPEDPEVIEPPLLEGFSYQILSFNYVPNTGNDSTLLQFEIQLNNTSDFNVTGVPWITVSVPGLEFSTANYASDAINACLEIQANSSCTFIFDKEYPIDAAGTSETFEIINVQYIIIDQ